MTLLGRYWLKDFDEPQSLFQLTGHDLDRDFPVLKVTPAFGHNLPEALTRLVGRERDLTAIVSLVDETRLLTLTGPGGVGKTRLALASAHRAIRAFADGVRWCALDSVTNPAAVASSVASAVGVREQPGRPLTETIVEHLRAKRVLLVIDNCEHVIDVCALLVAALLQRVPGLSLLATSRQRIGVYGEKVWPVEPLSVPAAEASPTVLTENPAARLFLDRMAAVRGDVALTDDSARAVAGICRAVDGLPLALELAAARTRTLSPMQIVSRLDQRLALLTGGERDRPGRQHALRSTIEWSYSLLTDDEQRLFRRLAVFVGGGTLEAAEQVSAADVDTLQSLVDKSLVRSVEERFSMLQTIRDFALQMLEENGECDELHRRHAVYFGAAAPELGSRARGSDRSALAEVDANYDNFTAAFDWAVHHDLFDVCEQLVEGLWYPWVRRGATTDGYQRALSALERSPRPGAGLLSLTGELARFVGDLERAVDLKRAALNAFEAQGAPARTVAAAHTDLAEALIERGDLTEAQHEAEQGYALRQQDGAPYGVAHARAPLIMLDLARGENASAAAQSSTSIDAFRAAGTRSDLGWECVRAASAHCRIGEIRAACHRLREALRVGEEIAEAALLVAAIEQAATVAVLTGDPDAAMRLLGAARAGRSSTGFLFRTDERALEIVRDALRDDEREVLLNDGARRDLHAAVQDAHKVLDAAAEGANR